jgi:hypothetical protein
MPMTNYLANQIGNATLRGTTYTGVANVYASLYSVTPTASASGTELTGNGYSRQLITFSSAANGVVTSNTAVTFTNSGNAWPTIVAFGIADASSTGNLLYYKGIQSRNVQLNGNVVLGSGNVTITLNG